MRSKPPTDTAIFTAYEESTPSDLAEPERNLMRAILRTALEDVRKTGDAFSDARRFFLNQDDEYIFSFSAICNHLNICASSLRLGLGFQELPISSPKYSSSPEVRTLVPQVRLKASAQNMGTPNTVSDSSQPTGALRREDLE